LVRLLEEAIQVLCGSLAFAVLYQPKHVARRIDFHKR
jgi:hypothetical protein